MRKWRHDNPHAERQIAALKLPGWKSRATLEREDREREATEAAAAELQRKRQHAAELGAEARAARRRATEAAAVAVTPELRAAAAELASEAWTAERAAATAALALPVPWSELEPAELFFRWMLERAARAEEGEEWGAPSLYSRWAHETREAWFKARNIVAHTLCEPPD